MTRAVTLHQPWATCTAWHGRFADTRTWMPPDWVTEAPIAIHAGAQFMRAWADDLRARGVPLLHGAPGSSVGVQGYLPRLAIVAVARGLRVMSYDQARRDPDPTIHRWAIRGPFIWTWREVDALVEPVPCAGQPGFWELPEDVAAAVDAAPKIPQPRITYLDNEGALSQ